MTTLAMPLNYGNPLSDSAKLARRAGMWRAIAIGTFIGLSLVIIVCLLLLSGTWRP